MNKEFKLVDLTHPLSPEVPTWDGSCGFELIINTDYKDGTPPDLYRAQSIKCGAGVGTHMDAPAHFVEGGRTIDQLTLEELIVDCVVIDVSSDASGSYVIMPRVVEKFEKEYGEIKPNNLIIFYTGWDKHWGDREKYNNNHKFPSIDPSTAEVLLKRNIVGLGIDTLSADTGVNGFPVHHIILGAGKYLVENIANAKGLPPTGAKCLVLPINIKNGTEAPIRLIGLL